MTDKNMEGTSDIGDYANSILDWGILDPLVPSSLVQDTYFWCTYVQWRSFETRRPGDQVHVFCYHF